MAAEEEGRTEEPSEYKLEKARKEGRVAKSQEVSGALILLFCVIMLIFLSKYLLNQFIGILTFYFSRCNTVDLRNPVLMSAFLNFFLRCVLPIALIGLIAAIAGNIIQTKGFIFSLTPIQPKFSKIIPSAIKENNASTIIP